MRGMPRSWWATVAEALATVVMLVGPPVLVSRLDWPLGEDVSWTWLLQYLRGGTLPAEVVLAVFVALLWAVWAAYLIIIALDVISLLRGLIPRVGLVRLVWVLTTGGATAASTQAAAVAAPTDTAVEIWDRAESEGREEPVTDGRGQDEDGAVERTRTLAGFGFDSDQMTSSMRNSLEPTLGMIEDFGLLDTPVMVTGHTDPVGDPGYNQALSERRAQVVADHLAEHVEGDVVFEVAGAGSAQPPAEMGASYAGYRRVEIAYTLQPPDGGEPDTVDEVDEKGEDASGPLPEQVQVDVNTVSSEGPSPLLVGAVAAAAGVGVGYAAGRRHAHARKGRPQAKGAGSRSTSDRPGDSLTETSGDNDSSSGDLVRYDLEGVENGVIDAEGYVLVGEQARVDARQGVAFTGVHAAEVLAAVVSGHGGQGPVIATRAAVEALGGTGFASGVQVVSDLPGARIAVETVLLTGQRQSMDDEFWAEEASEPSVGPALVVFSAAEAHGAREVHQALRGTPGVVAAVLGEPAGPGTVVHCDQLEQARVTSEDGQTFVAGPLRDHVRPVHHGHGAPVEEEASVPESAAHRPEPAPVPEVEAVGAAEPTTQPTPAPALDESGSAPPPAPPSARVRVRLFAPQPVCEVNGRDVLARSSSRLLLAMLALSPRGLSESQIDEVLAPGKDEGKARKNRYNAITGLRAPLREALDSEGAILFKKQGRYFLQEDFFDIDAAQAKTLRRRLGHPSEDREALLRELVLIWEKPLLSDCEEAWFAPHRKHYLDQLVEVLVLVAKETESAESRVSFLRKAMDLDRFNESIYQDTMCVYGGMGRPDAVRRTYRSLEKALGDLKKKPSPVSEQLLDELTRPEPQSQG